MTEVIRIEYKKNRDIYSSSIKPIFGLFYNNILEKYDNTLNKKDNFLEMEKEIEKLDDIALNIEPIVNTSGENIEITIDAESTTLVLKNDKYNEKEKDDIVNASIKILKDNFHIVNIGIQFRDNITNKSNEFTRKFILPLLLKGKEDKLTHSRLIYSLEESNGVISIVFMINKDQEDVSLVSQINDNFKEDYIFNYKYSYLKYLDIKNEVYSKINDSI